MNMPGFTAEAAIKRAAGAYVEVDVWPNTTDREAVVIQRIKMGPYDHCERWICGFNGCECELWVIDTGGLGPE